MSYPEKTIIAVNLNSNYHQHLLPLKEMPFLKQTNLEFIYVFPTVSYGFVLEGTLSYPMPNERDTIIAEVEDRFHRLYAELFLDHQGTFKPVCLFSEKPQQELAKYVNETKADMLIIAPTLKKGIFESSFAAYLGKHAHADLFALRPH